MLKEVRADQDFRAFGAGTIAGGAIDGVADDGELHAVRGTDESMEHLAAMDSDADLANGEPARAARFITFLHGILHGQRRAQGLVMLRGISLRAAEDRQNSVAKKLVNGSIMLKNRIDQS